MFDSDSAHITVAQTDPTLYRLKESFSGAKLNADITYLHHISLVSDTPHRLTSDDSMLPGPHTVIPPVLDDRKSIARLWDGGDQCPTCEKAVMQMLGWESCKCCLSQAKLVVCFRILRLPCAFPCPMCSFFWTSVSETASKGYRGNTYTFITTNKNNQ